MINTCTVLQGISKSHVNLCFPHCSLQTANLTDWRLTDSETQNSSDAKSLDFDSDIPGCEGLGNFTIEPSRTLSLTPKSASNPCGFPFTINFR